MKNLIISKKDFLTYFEVDEQLLTVDVVSYLNTLFPIEYEQLNFDEYKEYISLVLQILNKLSFDIDFDRNWIVILQNIVENRKNDVINSLKPIWFRDDKFYVIDKKFCKTNTKILDWKYQLADGNGILVSVNNVHAGVIKAVYEFFNGNANVNNWGRYWYCKKKGSGGIKT